MVFDAKKAHLHAFAEREVYIELPPEWWKLGVCGELIRSLYGMRDAPALWERFLAAQLEAVGFIRGKANPCLFRHESRDILAVVHGDDVMFIAIEEDFKMGAQSARTSDLAEGGRHHWRRQLGFEGTQGLEQRVCGHGLCRVQCDLQVDLWWCPLPGSPHCEALEYNAEMHHVVFRRG